jgi:hypothetical protein
VIVSKSNVPPKGSDPNSKAELALLLRDAVRHSVQIEREAALAMIPKQSRVKPIALGLLLAAATAFSAWSFLAKPEFIWGSGATPISPERTEASARLAMYLQARRLDLYREREGEYPEALAVVGGDTSLGYERSSDTSFALTITVGGKRLELASGSDRESFLGSSRELVQQKVGR